LILYADDSNVLVVDRNEEAALQTKLPSISSFRRVLYVVCFLLGNYAASGFYMPTFRNTLSVPSS